MRHGTRTIASWGAEALCNPPRIIVHPGRVHPNSFFFFLMIRRPPRPPLFPYTPLFRSAGVLRGLDAADQVTHAALDELPDGKPVEHLRSVLVAIGSLPPRDEHMARLERWITHMVAQRHDADERKLLHRYALWHVVRRLRGRLAGADTTRSQSAAARGNIRAAIALLDWLAEHSLTLATARQGDLEAWLA